MAGFAIYMKLSPLRAVRKYCLWCMGEQPNEVLLDPADECPLFLLRFGHKVKGLSVLKQIKARCKDCCESVKKCDALDCQIYPYRFGHNPSRAGLGGFGGK